MLGGLQGYRVTMVERGRIRGDALPTRGIARGGVVQLAAAAAGAAIRSGTSRVRTPGDKR
jgi:hypothetical protein